MTDHANELRRHARKIPHPQGETPGVVLRAADEIECLRAKIEAMERQEPSEQDASVRKAWARFSHELHRSPDAPYPGMADAFEQHFSQSFIDREWRVESGVWAAAWKAAKRHGAQPASSINEGVRKVTLGFRWESEAQHHIPTIEIEFDPVSPDSPNDAKGWQDRDRIASMLSPEVKP